MKPKSKYERQIIKKLHELTDQSNIERTRNGHIKVTFEGNQKVSVIFGGSPSDRRSTKNALANVRRAIVAAGIEPQEA